MVLSVKTVYVLMLFCFPLSIPMQFDPNLLQIRAVLVLCSPCSGAGRVVSLVCVCISDGLTSLAVEMDIAAWSKNILNRTQKSPQNH